ncbi:MAG: class I adenylate-forming enzyme family protein [Polyangiales bacterium]
MDRLHGFLRASTERNPEKPLFVKRGVSVTYREVEDRAARLATLLVDAGVQKGDRVAVLFDADADYMAAFYGALMAGAAAVPLCPDTRTAALDYSLAHSGARAVVMDASNLHWLDGQAKELPELRAVIVRGTAPEFDLGHIRRIDYAETATAPRYAGPDASGEELAAVVYTSGTTGRPKGVMLAHRNIVANTESIVEYLELTSDDVAGMVMPFYYVYGNSVIHTHIAVGGTIAHIGSMAFLGQVVDGLSRFQCTGFAGVPSTFARLLSYRSFDQHDLSHLRYLTQAGGAMMPKLIDQLRVTFPKSKVFVMYGQTEASARLSYLPPERLVEKLGSCGKAIPGVTLKICDPEGHELPRGEMGEVVAQGENVMLGYLNDPENTAKALRPEGLRTGDFGRMDEDGYVFLTGRGSELIKSGGHRIGPYDIEQALIKTKGVYECAVTGVPDEILGEAIAAYIIAEPGATLDKKDLLDHCHAELPHFKMPQYLFVVEDLPRSQGNKVLRNELKKWFAEGKGTRL